MSEVASSVLTNHLDKSDTQAASQGARAKIRWLAQTARWLSFADLIPETPIYSHMIAAAGTEAEPCRRTQDALRSFFTDVLPQTAKMTPNPPEAQKLLEVFEKQIEGCRDGELNYTARAALFFLITGEPDRATSNRLLDLVRKHLPQDDELDCDDTRSASTSTRAHSQVSALSFVEADLTHRLWDELRDRQDEWAQASQA